MGEEVHYQIPFPKLFPKIIKKTLTRLFSFLILQKIKEECI